MKPIQIFFSPLIFKKKKQNIIILYNDYVNNTSRDSQVGHILLKIGKDGTYSRKAIITHEEADGLIMSRLTTRLNENSFLLFAQQFLNVKSQHFFKLNFESSTLSSETTTIN